MKSISLDEKKMSYSMIDKEMTIAEIAKSSGLSKTTISTVKRGKRCRPETAQRIAGALGVDVSQIMKE